MAVTLTYQEWMKLTYGGRTSRRSNLLQAVDRAFKTFEDTDKTPGAKDQLTRALMAWMTSKGNGWKFSVRNKHNAVDSLYRQLTGFGGGPGRDTWVPMLALQMSTAETLNKIFEHAEVRWTSAYKKELVLAEVPVTAGMVKRAGYAAVHAGQATAYHTKHGAQQVKLAAADNKYGLSFNSGGAAMNIEQLANNGQARKMAMELVGKIVPTSSDQSVVMQAIEGLLPGFARQLTASMTPFVGLMLPVGAVIYNYGKASKNEYDLRNVRMHAERSFGGATSRQAIEAMARIIERERNANVFSGTVSLGEAGGKLAGILCDGGTATNAAIGLSANVVKLLNIVRIVWRDIQEKRAANRLLKSDEIDLSVFQACPLVGCYLICCAPTSVLMELVLNRFGRHGWMDIAEHANTHIVPLRNKARYLIKSHRFEIPSLERHPGMLEVNKSAIKEMIGRMGTTGMVGMGPAGGGQRASA